MKRIILAIAVISSLSSCMMQKDIYSGESVNLKSSRKLHLHNSVEPLSKMNSELMSTQELSVEISENTESEQIRLSEDGINLEKGDYQTSKFEVIEEPKQLQAELELASSITDKNVKDLKQLKHKSQNDYDKGNKTTRFQSKNISNQTSVMNADDNSGNGPLKAIGWIFIILGFLILLLVSILIGILIMLLGLLFFVVGNKS
jgi:hypothetical protein